MKPTQQATDIDFIKVAVIINCEGNIAISGSPKRRKYVLHVRNQGGVYPEKPRGL